MFASDVIRAIKAHAIAAFPNEACGLVVGKRYVACRNVHPKPKTDFEIDPAEYLAAQATGPVLAVVHSHPDGPDHPTFEDMQYQIASGVAWGIVLTNGDQVRDPFWWGGTAPIPPLIGRDFRHGVTDCYSSIRDPMRMPRAEVERQLGVKGWPFDRILLPEFPRDADWWTKGEDLYRAGFRKAGYEQIDESEARMGDVFLGRIRHGMPTHHGGILLDRGLVLHHKQNRLSAREPLGPWRSKVTHWLRYTGNHAS